LSAPAAVRVGTAGWSIPTATAAAFPDLGSHLHRYSRVFAAVEINSSFHRPHRTETYRRWADATPPAFRFAVKLPKTITHTRRLIDVREPLAVFLEEASGLGDKLAVLLVQLPPSLVFEPATASAFFTMLQDMTAAAIACEPRHPSWFDAAADACLTAHRIARVAADPVLAPGADRPGGWSGLRYHRLHGAPRIYYSAYEETALDRLADRISGTGAAEQWVMFDNTASGAATADALSLRSKLARRGQLPVGEADTQSQEQP
jgi:uncharacterized protein YecE (DUF72 family)